MFHFLNWLVTLEVGILEPHCSEESALPSPPNFKDALKTLNVLWFSNPLASSMAYGSTASPVISAERELTLTNREQKKILSS